MSVGVVGEREGGGVYILWDKLWSRLNSGGIGILVRARHG